MTQVKNPKGAGRKPTPESERRVRTQISLSPALMAKFKELGASRWLKRMLEEAK